MVNPFKLVRYIPKRTAVVSSLFIAAFVPAAIFAWGPDRATYTMENPADKVVFNSITNNSEVGDERNFLVIKDAANTADGGWQDEVTAEPGKEYLVRVYVHNDAAENLNLKALNTRVKVNVPTTTGKSVELGGFVSADNATPREVWDTAGLVSDTDFNVAYVQDSARLYNNHFGQTGVQLSNNIVTNSGALVGYDKLDGVVPGCMKYAGYVTFKIKVQGQETPDFTLKKQVKKSGTTTYGETVKVNPGENVDFRMEFKNIGDVKLDNVVIKDQLPAGLSLVSGSAKLYNTSYTNGFQLADTITTTGVNIGNYAKNVNAFVVLTAKVDSNDKLPVCGTNTLKNIAKAENDYGNVTDDATVTVDKECQTPPPAYECKTLTVEKISRNKFTFTTTATATNGAVIKDYTYNLGDGTVVTVPEATYTHNYTRDGNFTATVVVNVTVDGQVKSTPVGNCKVTVKVDKEIEYCKPGIPVGDERCEDKPVPAYECKSVAVQKISRDTFKFTVTASASNGATIKDYTYTYGDGKSETITAANSTHTYETNGDFTATVVVNVTVDGETKSTPVGNCKATVSVKEEVEYCKPGIPVGDERCEDKPEECKPGIPAGDTRCEDTPETPETPTPEVPEVLPSTGPVSILSGIVGSSALGLGVHSWVSSRRTLRDAMKRS